jgi:hypothetical protein
MIDKNKQYRTRDGRDVRIYATDGASEQWVHGAVENTEGWCQMTWCLDGLLSISGVKSATDLVEVKPEKWYPICRRVDASYFNTFVGRPCYGTKAEALDNRCGSGTGYVVVGAWKDET